MSRHRIRLAVASVVAGALLGAFAAVPAGAAAPALTAAAVTSSADLEIPVGTAGPAGNLVIGTGVTFSTGDTINIQLDDSDSGLNCSTASNTADYVAFTTTPTVSTGGTLAASAGLTASTPGGTIPGNCVNQAGGTKFDILTVSVTAGGPGPITLSNVNYSVGVGTPAHVANSAGTGPVKLTFSGTAVGSTPFTLASADASNAWVTDLTLDGSAGTVVLPSGPVTVGPLTINEHLLDALGGPSTNTDVCIDIEAGAVWTTRPTVSVGGAPGDSVTNTALAIGPNGVANSRLVISVASGASEGASSITLSGGQVQPGASPVNSRFHLTDCGTPPFGTPKSGGDPASGATFATVGYFSDPAANTGSTGPITQPGSSEIVDRLAGADRVATAIAISGATFPNADSATAVVLARADDFADALAGTPLAVAKGGPLLLTASNALDARTLAEIQRVLPNGGTVFVLGGAAALSDAVTSALTAAGFVVSRFAGVDRFDTAVRIARDGLANPATVFEVNGLNFPDALSAGAAAGAVNGAILLTNGSSAAPETTTYLAGRSGLTRYAVGGPAAAADPTATGIVGADRYATATMVAAQFFANATTFGLASGVAFPDALGGGARMGRLHGPLLLTDPNTLPAVVLSYLQGHAATLGGGDLFGGTAAVTEAVRLAAQAAIGGSAT